VQTGVYQPNVAVMSGPAESYYFGVFFLPTNNSGASGFAGIYATNIGVNGLFNGGSSVVVPGWAPGTARAFAIVGW